MFDIVGITMVKNEEDIIESFVRHNLHYLDALIILENNSDDSTKNILLSLQAEGLPIVIMDDPIFGYYQSEKITYAFKKVAKVFNPKYVAFLDADEFILAPSKDIFNSSLKSLTPGSQGVYCWKTYLPSPDLSFTGDPIRDFIYRRNIEDPVIEKIILSCHPMINDKIIVGRGAHSSIIAGGAELEKINLKEVSLAHIPVRSVKQIARKAIIGWKAFSENKSRTKDDGFQWKRLHDKILSNKAISRDDLAFEALNYVQAKYNSWPNNVVLDPIKPLYQNLKFSNSIANDSQNISDLIEELSQPIQKNKIFQFKNYNNENIQADDPNNKTTFKEAWHQENLFIDIPPFQHLADFFRPKSVLDLGCGLGVYPSYFDQNGADRVLGIDGFPLKNGFLKQGQYYQHDLTKPLNLGGGFDLVICTEVIEHLPPEYGNSLLDLIINHASETIVFSAAQLGQPGDGHINLRPIEYWINEFSRRGWNPDLFQTLTIRILSSFSWFQRNLVVFRRIPKLSSDDLNHLLLVSRHNGQWFPEPIKKISHPLTILEKNLGLNK